MCDVSIRTQTRIEIDASERTIVTKVAKHDPNTSDIKRLRKVIKTFKSLRT
jgi:hypothetical protein